VPRRNEPFFELRRSSIQGRGAFALRRIRRGTRIIEYTGEVIDDEEADERYDDETMRRHHTFLFAVEKDVVIDGAVGGSDASYINHSCEPNCEAVIEDQRVFIEALRTIEPGEELLYDYQYERDGEPDKSWEKLYACHCGAPSCRGTILAPEKKRKPRRAKKGARKRSRASAKKSARKAGGGSSRAKRPNRGSKRGMAAVKRRRR
jgi:SET domain-containing protein